MIHVHWSDEDQCHVATSDEHPSLSWCDDTQTGAVLGMQYLIDHIDDGLGAP